ncbi:unnamed protein product [Paramecium sonneborni]|uniref:Uncharacterized protein n=1 Tax=Paramecium sonneborni TaxID=65129 RepID=A0A8S1Q2X1_9CILI|nr:unnamed protein product [Paramecium sonneborni]
MVEIGKNQRQQIFHQDPAIPPPIQVKKASKKDINKRHSRRDRETIRV